MGSKRTTVILRKDLDEPASFMNVMGEIDVSTASELRRELFQLLKSESSRIIIRMKHVPYMDSAGVAVLLELIGAAREHETKVMILEPSPAAQKALEIVDLSELITIYQSVEECAMCMHLKPDVVRNQVCAPDEADEAETKIVSA